MAEEEVRTVLAVEQHVAERLRGEVATPLEEEAERAGALADPTRLAIAHAVKLGGELCVTDIAWIVERDEKLVSHHLRLLRTQKILSSQRRGKLVIYSVSETWAPLLDAVLGGRGEPELRLRAVG